MESLQDLIDVHPPSSSMPYYFSSVYEKRTKITHGYSLRSSESTTRMPPPALNTMVLASRVALPIEIPTEFERISDGSTPEERNNFLKWARSICLEDPDELDNLVMWANYTADSAASASVIQERKDYLKWAHATSSMAAPVEHKWRYVKLAHSKSTRQRKSWSLQEEISKPFETALKLFQEEINQNEMALKFGFPDLKQEHMIYTCDEGKHGSYQCLNALWIWPKLRNSIGIYDYQTDGGLKRVGEKIKEKFPESVMIRGRPTVDKLGLVTIKLSGKWIAKSIHKMLKDGIDTWAPKLPVERVIVDYPSVCEETDVDSFQRRTIGYTLMRIIEYCKVDVIIGHSRINAHKRDMLAQDVTGMLEDYTNMYADLIDCNKAKEDLLALWFGLCKQKADWILYVTPIHLVEYMEICFTAAKLKWISSGRHKPARTSYAGFQSCTHAWDYNLIARRLAVEQGIPGESANLLGYTAEAVSRCVFTFTILKTHRLAVWAVDIDEMFKEAGNTFLYLLNTRAKILKITDEFRKDINELKKASEFILEELILEKAEGWEKGEERILGFHLLKFTEALEESCLSVLPHILCKYLYDLSNKFNSYYSSVLKVGSVRETSTLLLCEATAVVTEKCFLLLDITPSSSKEALVLSVPLGFPSYLLRDRQNNSRLELFSFRTAACKQFHAVLKGEVFGHISVSDKFGLLSDEGSHFFEPKFAHIPLFNRDLCNPVKTINWGLVYLGNPGSSHSVPLTRSIEFRMELYVTKKEKKVCHQLCHHKIELDLSNFWEEEKAYAACGVLKVEGQDGPTYMYYALLKEALDVALEVKFKTTRDRKVRGYVFAYYGEDFFYDCYCSRKDKDSYMALLFLPNTSSVLTSCNIPLIRSKLAVPLGMPLIIKAYLEDESGEVIMKNSVRFGGGCSIGTISGKEGKDCSFEVKVDWNYGVKYV